MAAPPAADLADDDAIARLRQLLAGSLTRPRALASLEVPDDIRRLLDAQTLKGLRAAAVLVPIVRHAEGDTVLLTRRSETLRQHTGQISFPGGGRDPEDSDAAATALRESEEEVGLAGGKVEVIGCLDDMPTLTGYCITPVVGLVTPPLQLRPDPAEVAEVFELPFTAVLDAARFERKSLSRGPVQVPFFELRHGVHRIWGATAAILWTLHRLLADA